MSKSTRPASYSGPASAHGRPLGATLLFTALFAGLAGFGYWYNQVYQFNIAFSRSFEAHFESGILADGKTRLKRVRTGHEGIDDLLALLVLFFSPGTYAHSADGVSGQAALVQQAQLLLQLVTVLALQMIEGSRARNRWTLLSFPSLWAFFYQTMSGMFVIPLWFALYTVLSHKSSYFSAPSGLAVRTPLAKAFLPSLLLLYIVPTIAMYIPYADPFVNQDVTAFWQGVPMYVNISLWLLALTVFSGSSDVEDGNKKTPATPALPTSTRHINRAYGLAFFVGVVTQVGVAWLIMTSNDPGMSFSKVFVPALDLRYAVKGENAAGFVYGTVRMFQWDHIGIFGATVLWAVLGVYDTQTRLAGPQEKGGVVLPVLALLAGVVVIGPGAAVAAFGVWREKKLAALRLSSEIVEKKAQ